MAATRRALARAAAMRPLTPGRQALVLQYRPWSRVLVRPYRRRWGHLIAEFESVADLALVQAAAEFVPAPGHHFATLATFRVRQALGQFARVQRPLGYRYHTSGDEPPPTRSLARGMESARPPGRAPAPPADRGLEDREARAEAEAWLRRRLPPRLAEACRRHYLEGEAPAAVAAALGCSTSRVARLLAEAREALGPSAPARPARVAEEWGVRSSEFGAGMAEGGRGEAPLPTPHSPLPTVGQSYRKHQR